VVRCSVEVAAPSAVGQGDFPVLDQEVHGQRLVYMDSAATSQKPRQVLDAVEDFYSASNAAVHPGTCGSSLAKEASAKVEEAREKVAKFVNAPRTEEIIFTRNATEAINIVARSWALKSLNAGDEIIISVMEHHSNIVPWQMVAEKTGAVLKFLPLTENQELDLMALPQLLTNKTRLISLQHVSNVLGAVNPVADVVEFARDLGVKVLVDACQSVPHMPVDVQALGCDWLVASGHKMCAPTGIGFLWGKTELLSKMDPLYKGGLTVEEVEGDNFNYHGLPSRLEGGMVPTAEAIGLGAACDYLSSMGMDKVHDLELELGRYLYERLSAYKEVTIYGPKDGERAALCAFNVDGVHPTDLATMMDLDGVAIRSGHHCAQPLHRKLGVEASARASLYVYNSKQDVDAFIAALESAVPMLGGTLTLAS